MLYYDGYHLARSSSHRDYGRDAHDDPHSALYIVKPHDYHYNHPQTIYGYEDRPYSLRYDYLHLILREYEKEWNTAVANALKEVQSEPRSVLMYEHILSHVLHKEKIKYVLKDRDSLEYIRFMPVKIVHILAELREPTLPTTYIFGYRIRRRKIQK